jgi:hypothetical protein
MKPSRYFGILMLNLFLAGCSPATDHPAQISGTISLAPEMEASFSGFEPVYILLKSSEGKTAAVKKIHPAAFPMGYLLGAEDLVDADKRFEGVFHISVFIDKDGRGELSAGDLTGDYSENPVEAGSRRVDILIDRISQ